MSILPGLSHDEIQKLINQIPWYHEFEFGNGLKAHSTTPDVGDHKAIWHFLHHQLDAIDFQNKRVLEIGSWDGYWSFEAEKRGAAYVLSTDDVSQNWSAGQGIHLAKELFGSNIDIKQDVSAYQLEAKLKGEGPFDIIIYFGVYYHLFDPLYAFSQIRHLCGPNTVVLIDGPEGPALQKNTAFLEFANHAAEFLPSRGALEQLIEASYLKIDDRAEFETDHTQPKDTDPIGRFWRLRHAILALFGNRQQLCEHAKRIWPHYSFSQRVFLKASAFTGKSRLHAYRPPFGLDKYDNRFGKAL
ncbi:MAG: methyltransferase domain-containing protein [Planctomycetota bacterium]|nr:methyltransferase domain-containing protein [Planctomycetota bacterium]